MSEQSENQMVEIMRRNQRESSLLRPPPEIRQLIYGYTLGGNKWNAYKSYNHQKPSRSRFYKDGSPHSPKNALALLLSCKQIYREAHGIPPIQNTFAFNTLRNFTSWSGRSVARHIVFAELRIRLKCPFNREQPDPRAIGGWVSKLEQTPLCSKTRFPSLRHLKIVTTMNIDLCEGQVDKWSPPPNSEYTKSCIERFLGEDGKSIVFTHAWELRACRCAVPDMCDPPMRDWDGLEASWEPTLQKLRLDTEPNFATYMEAFGSEY